MPNHTTSNDLVAIGRLRRKIESLKKQRDHWKEEYDRLKIFCNYRRSSRSDSQIDALKKDAVRYRFLNVLQEAPNPSIWCCWG